MWNNLEKGHKLYILVPYILIDNTILIDNKIEYHYQETNIINIHEYQNLTNIRFKYTDQNNKRRRVELAVNRTKYTFMSVSANKYTSFARNYEMQYGDLIVTYISKEYLFAVFKNLKQNKFNQIHYEIFEKTQLAKYISESTIKE